MEETPRPRPVPRDASAPIPLPLDDGEARPRRATAAPSTPAPVPAGTDATQSDAVTERADAVDRIRNGPVSIERVQVQRPGLSKRERRGAMTAGALGLPLVTLGLITLAVPIGAWYFTTIFTSVLVAVASLVATEAQVRGLDASITAVDPTSFGSLSLWLIIAGVALLLIGLVVSWLVLRGHGVFHPILVTLTAVPMSLGLSAILQLGAGALAGLVFQLGDGGVSAVIANAAFALLLFLVASVAIALVTGILVWLWMSSVFRATVVTGVPESS